MSNLTLPPQRNMIDLAKERAVNFEASDAAQCEVKYKIFTNNSVKGTHLSILNIKSFTMDTTIPTKMFIHGWRSLRPGWYSDFKDEYFKKGTFNIIYVDWSIPGGKQYTTSSANVKPVGRCIADFVISTKMDLKKTHIISKSLGCHLASYIGKQVHKRTGNKIARITAMDPASPLFEVPGCPEEKRLNSTDAEFVDVIHTDAGYYGFSVSLGTVDFYPNGGDLQPGCADDEDGHKESHDRSNMYFLEAINSTEVKARKATSWNHYEDGKYSDADPILFGDNVPLTATGNYYLRTNATKPFTEIKD